MISFQFNLIFTIIIIFVIYSFIYLNLNGKDNNKKEKVNLILYDIITVIFIILLITLILFHGLKKGFYESLFIWAFFAVCTPIPESGLLITLPLKRFFNINMYISQIFVTLISIFIVYIFYKNKKNILNNLTVGKYFNKIINNKNYLIIITSILSSIIGTNLIENKLDQILYKKEIEYFYENILIFIILILVYIYSIYKMNNI